MKKVLLTLSLTLMATIASANECAKKGCTVSCDNAFDSASDASYELTYKMNAPLQTASNAILTNRISSPSQSRNVHLSDEQAVNGIYGQLLFDVGGGQVLKFECSNSY